jgi:hypothetical protein
MEHIIFINAQQAPAVNLYKKNTIVMAEKPLKHVGN